VERPGLTARNHSLKVSSFLAALWIRLTLARFALTDADLISCRAILRSADCFRWAARFSLDSRIPGMVRQSNGWSDKLGGVALRSSDLFLQTASAVVPSVFSVVGDSGADNSQVAVGSSAVVAVVPSVSSVDDSEIS